MMKITLLVFCALLTVCYGDLYGNGKRLIQFDEKTTKWMTVEEVEELIVKPVHNFIDITDLKEDNLVKVVNAQPIPTDPVLQSTVNPLLAEIVPNNIFESLTKLTAFSTRYFRSASGVEASQFVLQQYLSVIAGRVGYSAINVTYSNFPQLSVIATIPGAGPNANSRVIIGAHLDSVGSTTSGTSPGADDDGSGTVTLLEIWRVLVTSGFIPDYTIEFHGYAAEEGGLLGSQGIANLYASLGIDVQAMLQLDMVGYNQSSTVGVVTDYTSAELNAFVRKLIPAYTTLKQVDTVCGYGCSDHASWNRVGYRSAFPFETAFRSSNPYIHSANDVISHLSLPQMTEFAKLGLAFLVEVAGVVPQ